MRHSSHNLPTSLTFFFHFLLVKSIYILFKVELKHSRTSPLLPTPQLQTMNNLPLQGSSPTHFVCGFLITRDRSLPRITCVSILLIP